MGRLAQTENLTDVQEEILRTVRDFVEKEISRTRRRSKHAMSTRRRSSRG